MSSGELYDIGYQHYDGPREGRMRARKALFTNGMRTALGIGRGMRSKIFPGVIFVIVTLIAVIMIILATLPEALDVPGPAGYYQTLSFFILLFSAVVAPELLCPDRRDGVISLYLVRPLTPMDYVSSRWLAFLCIALGILYAGQAVLFIGVTLASDNTVDYLRDNWLDVPRFIGAGLVLGVYVTTLAMAASAFTTRRAYAAVFVIGLAIISAPSAAILTACDEEPRIHGVYEGNDDQGNWIIAGELGFFNDEGDFVVGNQRAGESRGVLTFASAPELERFVIAVDAATKIETGLAVGHQVRVKFETRSDGSRLAREIGFFQLPLECDQWAGESARWFALIDLLRLPIHVTDMIFAEDNSSSLSRLAAELPKAIPIAWYLLVTGGAGLALVWRYRRITS